MMVTAALILLVSSIPSWWFATSVAVIIIREIFVSALRDWMSSKGKSVVVKVGLTGIFLFISISFNR